MRIFALTLFAALVTARPALAQEQGRSASVEVIVADTSVACDELSRIAELLVTAVMGGSYFTWRLSKLTNLRWASVCTRLGLHLGALPPWLSSGNVLHGSVYFVSAHRGQS